MKKVLFLLLSAVFLSGCATYKFQHGQKPYDTGYVASREGYVIPEYTLGQENTVPEKVLLAKERFKRRRRHVEHYYKRMGFIENNFKKTFLGPALMFVKIAGGVFRLPGIAISDYRYEHNAAYRKRIDERDQRMDDLEEARIKSLKDILNSYVQNDLTYELSPGQRPQQAKVLQKTVREASVKDREAKKAPKKQAVPRVKKQPPVKLSPDEKKAAKLKKTVSKEIRPKKEKPEKKPYEPAGLESLPLEPRAVIIARPVKGLSPLTVHFYGNKSYSQKGKIVSYSWDFGDTDTSSRPNPVNTYYSTSFEPKQFTVRLTVQDDKGKSATADLVIEVLNR